MTGAARLRARLAVLLLGALLAAAAPAAAIAAATGRFERGLLWRVEVPGGPASYLFGTLHASDERVLDLPPPVRKAVDSARGIAIEVIDDEAAARRFRSAMVTREPRLPALLGEPDYARIDALLREAGIPAEARPRFKPWATLLVLSQPRGMHGIRLDNLLLMEARDKGKPIHALETVDEQIAAFDGLPDDAELALLRHAETRQDAIAQAVRPMVEAYLARDLGAIFRLNAEAMGGDPAMDAYNALFLSRVLYERNARFAERLAPLLREGHVLALFGALHLYGERGVPALLEKQGFRVRRIH